MNKEYANYKNREFICACGKNYLSYAALFTHIKQKHEGKAPGPITRPRSQRKRGRPRKNPHVENQGSNSQEDEIQNGILKGIDNNNNNQKEEKQQKTKKAAQLLGCGGFAAFTAYKPDCANSAFKKQHDSNKKSFVKKASMQVLQRKCSNTFNPIIGAAQQIGSAAHISAEQSKIEMMSFCQNISNLNKIQLRKIFEGKNEDFSDFQSKTKEFEFYKQLNLSELPDKNFDIQTASINCAVSQFLQQTKNALYQDQQTKVQQSGSGSIEAEQNNNYDFDQTILLTIILLQQFVSQYNIQSSQLGQKSVFELQNYLQKFIRNVMPLRIEEMSIQNYNLFKGFNPIKFMVYFSNWVVLKKAECQLSKPATKYEQQMNNEQSMEQEVEEKQHIKDEQSHDEMSDNHQQFIVGEHIILPQKINPQ